MGKLLTLILNGVIAGSGKQFLTGAGLALMSGAATLLVLNQMMNYLVAQAGFAGNLAAILGMLGVDIELSMILSALVYRSTIGAGKLSLVKAAAN